MTFNKLNAWISPKDTGFDLLITDEKNTKLISLHVKLPQDFTLFEASDDFGRNLVTTSWLILSYERVSSLKLTLGSFSHLT